MITIRPKFGSSYFSGITISLLTNQTYVFEGFVDLVGANLEFTTLWTDGPDKFKNVQQLQITENLAAAVTFAIVFDTNNDEDNDIMRGFACGLGDVRVELLPLTVPDLTTDKIITPTPLGLIWSSVAPTLVGGSSATTAFQSDAFQNNAFQ